MKSLKRYIYAFFYTNILVFIVHAEIFQFDHLSVDQGLAQNSVLAIYQDSLGFLWFCTQDGLTKYDGYTCTNFTNDPGNTNSLSGNLIMAIHETSRYFFIGTAGQLNRLDKYTGKIKQINIRDVSAIVEDSSGVLWLGSLSFGLYSMDVENGLIQRYMHDPADPASISDNHIFSLHIDRNNTLWIGTEFGGLSRMNRKNNQITFTRFMHNPDLPASLSHNQVTTICEDANGYLWIGTKGGGLNRLNADGTFEHFFYDPNNHTEYPESKIAALLYDSERNALWIGTFYNGISLFSLQPRTMYQVSNTQHNAENQHSLSNNRINAIYKDRYGIIWIGTYGGGAEKLKSGSYLQNHKIFALEFSSLKAKNVWSFFQDTLDNIWIGTSNSVIQIPGSGKKHVHFDLSALLPVCEESQVRAITQDTFNRLWLAILGVGLANYDYVNNRLTVYQPRKQQPDSSNFYTMLDDKKGNLWLGGNGSGLYRFDKKQKKFYSADIQINELQNEKSRGWVLCLAERNGTLWFGTWNQGLFRYDPVTGKYRSFRQDIHKPNSLNNNTVLCLHFAQDGTLWIGTNGGGLNHFNPRNERFTAYTTKQGLSNNVIYGIVEDNAGRLWLTTNKGLSCFNPKNKSFINYDKRDGLRCNEFNLGACFKSKSGDLYFGGPKGFNTFSPNTVVNPTPPEIVLTSFKKFGEIFHFKKPTYYINEILLDYTDNIITFEFAALHYKNSSKNRYAYMLEGFDKEWINNGFKRDATFTNLDPGKYTFRVKAANSDGVWNEKGLAVHLKILPPYWKTWWFYSGIFFLIVLVVYGLHRMHLAQAIKLERVKNEERERLRRQMAADFHDELGHRVTKISLLSKLLHKGFQSDQVNANDYLDQIEENADCLFSEMKEFVWELDPRKDTLYDLIVQLKNFSDTLFENTDIAFQIIGLEPNIEKLQLPMHWRQNLLRIFKEGMHNVLKHAKNCSNVSLQVHFSKQTLALTLTDDGQGFDTTQTVTGNGLKNMKERAAKINGMLEIRSEPNKGARLIFNAKLP